MYQLPNKIFSQWAESIDNSLDYLVEEVIAWQEEPDFEGKNSHARIFCDSSRKYL